MAHIEARRLVFLVAIAAIMALSGCARLQNALGNLGEYNVTPSSWAPSNATSNSTTAIMERTGTLVPPNQTQNQSKEKEKEVHTCVLSLEPLKVKDGQPISVTYTTYSNYEVRFSYLCGNELRGISTGGFTTGTASCTYKGAGTHEVYIMAGNRVCAVKRLAVLTEQGEEAPVESIYPVPPTLEYLDNASPDELVTANGSGKAEGLQNNVTTGGQNQSRCSDEAAANATTLVAELDRKIAIAKGQGRDVSLPIHYLVGAQYYLEHEGCAQSISQSQLGLEEINRILSAPSEVSDNHLPYLLAGVLVFGLFMLYFFVGRKKSPPASQSGTDGGKSG